MLNRLTSDWNSQHFHSEEKINQIIETCHRTIDWSVNLYFKTLKKSLPLLTEKVLKDEKLSFTQAFKNYLLNETDLAQLIKDMEEHINGEVIAAHNKWLPAIQFDYVKIESSLEFLETVVREQKNTIKIARQVEKNICQLTTKTLTGLAPAVIPKKWFCNPTVGKTITRTLALDPASHYLCSSLLIEKQLAGLLDNMALEIKENLKFQLSEQLYDWFDRYLAEPVKDVVNQ